MFVTSAAAAGSGRSSSNLTSPSGEFADQLSAAGKLPTAAADTKQVAGETTETIKHSSSSIIGLRAAAFDQPAKATTKPADPEMSAAGPPSDDIAGPKPRPPPKPRPWSLVGVDRKSGEFTQVESSSSNTSVADSTATAETNDESEHRRPGLLGGSRGSGGGGVGGSVRDRIASLNKPESVSGPVAIGAGGSVRDRIANMNKSAVGGGSAAADATSMADNAAFSKQRKGNSLPRTAAETSSSSPHCRPKNSPKNLRKESDTTDDPRILKLDDDFMYEDTVNV